MARARLISTSLGSSRRFCRLNVEANSLSEFAQLLFVLLVINADDFGRGEADPFTVKLKVFPGSPRTEHDFERALAALGSVGLIQLYEWGGNAYLEVENFEAHQSGLHKRTKSRFPGPPVTDGNQSTSGSSGNSSGIPLEQNRTEQNRTESEENQKRTEGSAGAPAALALVLEVFGVRVSSKKYRSQIESEVQDLAVWREALDYWKEGDWGLSFTKILQVYHERKEEKTRHERAQARRANGKTKAPPTVPPPVKSAPKPEDLPPDQRPMIRRPGESLQDMLHRYEKKGK